MARPHLACLVTLFALLTALPAFAADFQYFVPVDRPAPPSARDGKTPPPGKAFLWLPPTTKTARGLLLFGQLGIEWELINDPTVRKACTDNDLAIVYFQPHIDGVFHFWDPANTSGPRLLKALDDLAKRSGHPEIRRVPWITAGHSTAGIYCRNVAYWQPARVAGIYHVKSGNFHQKDHLPPTGSLVGIPLVALNGQVETFGPEGGIRPELGRETQWVFVRQDIQQFRQKDPNYLMGQLVEPGADHFHGTPEDAQYFALFLQKLAKYRLPRDLPAGTDPVPCLPLKAEDGWLVDPDLKNPTHKPAPYAAYTGDKALAMWHLDKDMAEATMAFDRNLAHDQCLEGPTCTWLDEGDGWSFKAHAVWLDTMPDKFGGSIGNKKVGHSKTPFVYRCKNTEPVVQTGPDTFRILRPVGPRGAINIAAYHPGDEEFRSTIRWGNAPKIELPKTARKQTIDFAPLPNLKPGETRDLAAKATSGLPVYYEVDYGPVTVEGGKLKAADLPTNAQFPIPCKITAYQIGRRLEPAVGSAPPVSMEFSLVAP